jgi:hypothetical protein
MTTIHSIANQVYNQYLRKGKGFHSPDDALWQLNEYLEEHPDVYDVGVIVENVVNLLLESDF